MMNNTMEYKSYVGSVEFSEEDGIFFGKVMGIRALVSYKERQRKSLSMTSIPWLTIISRCVKTKV